MVSLWALVWHRVWCCCQNREQEVFVDAIWFRATWRAAAQELLLAVGSGFLALFTLGKVSYTLLLCQWQLMGSWASRTPDNREVHSIPSWFPRNPRMISPQKMTVSLPSTEQQASHWPLIPDWLSRPMGKSGVDFPHTCWTSTLVEGVLTLMEHKCSAATSLSK